MLQLRYGAIPSRILMSLSQKRSLQPPSFVAFLDVLESWMNASSVSFSKRMIDSSYLYTISYGLGGKWSAFLSLMVQAVFTKMGIADVSFEVTDGTIMFGIPAIKLRAK